MNEAVSNFKCPFAMRWRVLVCAAIVLFAASVPVSAQDDDFPEFRPTPKIELSKSELAALGETGDPKKYLRTALVLMESRLASAEESGTNGEYDAMHADLGGFHAVMDATLNHLIATETRRGKVVETFKRFEIALRGFAPRIEKLRRDAPDKYNAYIIKLLKRVRENRTRAVDTFYDKS